MTSPQEFLDGVLSQFYMRMHRLESDNYDTERFLNEGGDRSGEFDLQRHKNYLYFLFNQHRELCAAWDLLADDASRDLFLELVLFQLAGHLHVRLSTNTDRHWTCRRQANELPSSDSSLDYEGVYGAIRHFDDVEFDGERITIDSWAANIAWTFLLRQYYFERPGVSVKPEPGDHIIDAGACFGDTSLAFAVSVGDKGRVYAFEGLENHLNVIRLNLERNPKLQDRIKVFPTAVGDVDRGEATVSFNDPRAVAPGFSMTMVSDDRIAIRTIDSLVDTGEIERIDLIKMDIEGYELKALQGAERSIRRFCPKLAIAIYHKWADYYEIPQYLNRLELGYKFFIDHYTVQTEETVLYALPPDEETPPS